MKITHGKKFREEVDEFVRLNDASYMEAVLHYAEKHNLESETIAKLLDVNLKDLLEKEAKSLHLLK